MDTLVEVGLGMEVRTEDRGRRRGVRLGGVIVTLMGQVGVGSDVWNLMGARYSLVFKKSELVLHRWRIGMMAFVLALRYFTRSRD